MAWLNCLQKILLHTITIDPNVDEESPKVILNCRRIFWMQGEYVSDNEGWVKQSKASHQDKVSQHGVQDAEEVSQGPDEVAKKCQHLKFLQS